ncbi:HD domain-containing phosphohydrolase [Celerinatantimonas sp. MCCC 1A17872]|uniref:HD domain-containing phosphohydrolase n=1 Tax=Celerinatantimonas sp. MCCC 1A17872 TaxID=3177514 RepID=UPI0038CC0C31
MSVCSINVSAQNQAAPRILVLHSYDASYQWTSELQKGIDDANQATDGALKFSIEYLDTKRIFNPDYLATIRSYLRKKYKNYPFDGVIVTDDNALNFFNTLDMPNLRNLPTVAVGIGNPKASLVATTDKGVILYEKDYIEENIKLILRLRPNLQNLYFLVDRSYTASLIHQEVLQVIKKYPQINLVQIRDFSLNDTRYLLEKASPDDAVLLTHFNTEKRFNIFHEYGQIAYQIGHYSRAPVFVLWKFYISGGVLGGYVTRSYQLGFRSVQLLINQLPKEVHEPVANNPIEGFVFDYDALRQHHIDEQLLPRKSFIIGKPKSFIYANWKLLAITGSTIIILIAIIFVLALLLKRKREINRQSQKIVELQKKTVDVQKDLIHLLGDAIETRSGETGNHVKRVAKMSSVLAKLCGLSADECQTIEIVSPMHDIGKIGIQEAILEKPGKLDPDEWRIMQGHVDIGYKILSSSEGKILHYAAIIALEHHEHWNGNGYPSGKSGEDIHIFSRITAIVDVFDALLSERCYKKPWPLDRVINLFEEQCGKQFDPTLTKLFLDNIEGFVAIREKYPDKANES